jgi:hypothetical protein
MTSQVGQQYIEEIKEANSVLLQLKEKTFRKVSDPTDGTE